MWFLPVAGPEVCSPWALAFISFQEIKTQSLHLTVIFSQAQCRRALLWQLQQNWGHRGYFGPAVSLTKSYAVWLWQYHDCPSGLWLHVSLSKLWAFGLIIFSFHILVPHTWYLASYPTHHYSVLTCPIAWLALEQSIYVCSAEHSVFPLSRLSPNYPYHLLLQHALRNVSHKWDFPCQWLSQGASLKDFSKVFFKFMLIFSYGAVGGSGLDVWCGEN